MDKIIRLSWIGKTLENIIEVVVSDTPKKGEVTPYARDLFLRHSKGKDQPTYIMVSDAYKYGVDTKPTPEQEPEEVKTGEVVKKEAIPAEKPKRVRRTKAQIEADKLKEESTT